MSHPDVAKGLGRCPLPRSDDGEVLLAHGSGGKLTADLIERVFVPAFRNPFLEQLDDQAVLDVNGTRLAFTTDSFVVTPIFFPGGDIGSLAVNGTVNDLAMCGARPLYLSAGFILEEGFSLADLERLTRSMQGACDAAGVLLVTGDTKVVGRGHGDKVFINTSGVGLVEHGLRLSADRAVPGDVVILSGTIADHGMAVMATREELALDSEITSDTVALHGLVRMMVEEGGGLRCMRDPTRGGVATTLNEIAKRSKVGIVLDESDVPIRENVKGLCELLGMDPLYVANEGKLLAVVDPDRASVMLARMRSHRDGKDARIVGRVVADHPGMVLMRTGIGGTRVLDLLAGEQLPRIC